MNEKQIRVIDAIEALRGDAPKTMAKIGQLVAAHNPVEALRMAEALAHRHSDASARRGWQPDAFELRRNDELILSLRALAADAPPSPHPLISDATLAKIVRLLMRSDLAAWEVLTWTILEHVVEGRVAVALDVVHDRSADPALIAALEEANEEAARNADADRRMANGECCTAPVCFCGSDW